MSGAEQPATPAVDELKDAEQATQSFMAGFDADDNAERPTETPAAAAVESTPPEATPAPTPAPKLVQITEDDWHATQARAAKIDEISATLDKRFDQVLGTMGRTLERKLAEMQSTTPSGQAVQLDEADFKELTDEFPDVGALTLKGFNKALAKFKGMGASTQDNDEKAEARERKARLDELTEIHPTWQSDMWAEKPAVKDGAYVPGIPTAEFAAWTKTLPPEEVTKFGNSKSVLYVESKLRQFYAWKTAQAAQAKPPAATPAPAQQPSTRQRQIAAAVSPRGDSAAPPSTSGKSPFMAGYEEDD